MTISSCETAPPPPPAPRKHIPTYQTPLLCRYKTGWRPVVLFFGTRLGICIHLDQKSRDSICPAPDMGLLDDCWVPYSDDKWEALPSGTRFSVTIEV